MTMDASPGIAWDRSRQLEPKSFVQTSSNDEPTYIRDPAEGGRVGTDVYDMTMDASPGIPWDRSRQLEPRSFV